MENIKVYTHYLCKNKIEYRWRTIIQIGDSWEVRGTIFMKNPGSSKYVEPNISPIENSGLLEKLRTFDDTRTSLSYEWYEFSIDRTMSCVINLFKAYYETHGEQLSGVITTDDDIKHIMSPIYIGWGNLWRVPAHKENAQKIFSEVIKKPSYLCNRIEENKFYHP